MGRMTGNVAIVRRASFSFIMASLCFSRCLLGTLRMGYRKCRLNLVHKNVFPVQGDNIGVRCFSESLIDASQKVDVGKMPKRIHKKKVRTVDLQLRKRKNQNICMVTAYDFPSAVHADLAGIDVILVGDSVAMVGLGHETTLPVTLDEMIHHSKAVARGVQSSLIVGDMPFGAYEISVSEATRNAIRYMKEGNVDAVKLEGGKVRAETVRYIVQSGIAVLGHIGLTPQSISVLGGFRAQGKSAGQAMKLMEDALALQEAGCFALVIECVPASIAEIITQTLDIPTIGIGAGSGTNGQVLVYHDMLGMLHHPHHAKVTPRFCKQYAQIGPSIAKALQSYKEDVMEGRFPSTEYSPYKITKDEVRHFVQLLQDRSRAGHLSIPSSVINNFISSHGESIAFESEGASTETVEETEETKVY